MYVHLLASHTMSSDDISHVIHELVIMHYLYHQIILVSFATYYTCKQRNRKTVTKWIFTNSDLLKWTFDACKIHLNDTMQWIHRNILYPRRTNMRSTTIRAFSFQKEVFGWANWFSDKNLLIPLMLITTRTLLIPVIMLSLHSVLQQLLLFLPRLPLTFHFKRRQCSSTGFLSQRRQWFWHIIVIAASLEDNLGTSDGHKNRKWYSVKCRNRWLVTRLLARAWWPIDTSPVKSHTQLTIAIQWQCSISEWNCQFWWKYNLTVSFSNKYC